MHCIIRILFCTEKEHYMYPHSSLLSSISSPLASNWHLVGAQTTVNGTEAMVGGALCRKLFSSAPFLYGFSLCVYQEMRWYQSWRDIFWLMLLEADEMERMVTIIIQRVASSYSWHFNCFAKSFLEFEVLLCFAFYLKINLYNWCCVVACLHGTLVAT